MEPFVLITHEILIESRKLSWLTCSKKNTDVCFHFNFISKSTQIDELRTDSIAVSDKIDEEASDFLFSHKNDCVASKSPVLALDGHLSKAFTPNESYSHGLFA